MDQSIRPKRSKAVIKLVNSFLGLIFLAGANGRRFEINVRRHEAVDLIEDLELHFS